MVPLVACLALAAPLLCHGAAAQESAVLSRKDVFHPVFARNGMVVSQEAKASRVGREILKSGGNAVDAAIAMGFALAVTLPRAGNLGGGGFMLVHMARTGKTVALDYRETAPMAATKNMYLDAGGRVMKKASRYGYRAVGVPGTVAGLALAHSKYGSLPWAHLIAPAITLARDGVTVTPYMAEGLERRKKSLGAWESTRAVFFQNGEPVKAGDTLRQKDLAWSLDQISRHGADAFYRGQIAKRIVQAMKANDGLLTASDFEFYNAVMREPVRGTYRGVEIVSMPPPSSGGVHLIQMLNILEAYDLRKMGPQSAAGLHVMIEAMRRAFADRSQHLGDPDFWKVPVKGLTSKRYAADLRKSIDLAKATRSEDIRPGAPAPYESPDTTHFTVMDRFGNVVTNTYTLNFSYGSRVIADGTGIFLNNEMDDFSAKPGVPNAFGLVGGAANAISPKKRPLSSMTPLIAFKAGAPWLATGGPGGSRIITNMLHLLVNVIDHDMNIAEATAVARIHHQWLPDRVRIEKRIGVDTRVLLEKRGHRLKEGRAMGSTQSIMRMEEGFYGAADPRRPGALAVGF
jgi:gamma-glutamyltranspeptidase/glutathione hydrolase